ncbi:hypothetical protein BJF78_23410 [Pseudonocardia sp. CNS-139]|nr:hypothetical protein BJF78_23410 [Pseudonocardia sp. CNS-139]
MDAVVNAAVRLGGFAATLGLVFGAALWTGAFAEVPAALAPAPAGGDPHAEAAAAIPITLGLESSGLVSTAAGYALVPRSPTAFRAGVPGELAFIVTGTGGRAVTAFEPRDERLLGLVVARRDGAGYQRLDPQLGPDGVWRAPLTLPGGVHRAYAEFVPAGGPPLVLGLDLFAGGALDPGVFPLSPVAHVGDYVVRVDADLAPGRRSEVFVTIDRGRLPVADLEPYMGARGHLVAVRQSDLARLPTVALPPSTTPGAGHRSGPGLLFTVDVPAAGRHRLFVEFVHRGVLHTAEFAVGG